MKRVLIIGLILVQTISCKPQQQMKKYEWSPTACAPKNYPAEVLKGDFFMDDGNSIYIPAGHNLMHGWGLSGATHVSGPDVKMVPSSFRIEWISYLEEKVYGGTFELPKEKMAQFFEEGFQERLGKHVTYSDVVVGLAPGGVMVVWLLGGGKTVEIQRYQASEIQVKIKDYYPGASTFDTGEFIKKIKNNIINSYPKVKANVESTPYGLWDIYRKKYDWAPRFKFKAAGETILDQSMFTFYNGELFRTIGTNPKATEMHARAIPDRAGLYWIDAKGNRYGANLYFDETEIFNLFDLIFIKEENKQAELVIEVDNYNSSLTTFLKTDQNSYPLKNVRTSVFPSPKN